MTHDDAALDTARDVLDGTVCECGCLTSEHCTVDLTGHEPRPCGQCDDCADFQPVAFRIERASRKRRRR